MEVLELKPQVETMKAKVGHKLILSIKARRCPGGIEVTLSNGKEIGAMLRDTSRREGYPTPSTFAGVPIWSSLRAIEQQISLRMPNTEQLQPWVLRHAKLWELDEVKFTLNLPHSRRYLEEQVRNVGDHAQALYMEFCKRVSVQKDVYVTNRAAKPAEEASMRMSRIPLSAQPEYGGDTWYRMMTNPGAQEWTAYRAEGYMV